MPNGPAIFFAWIGAFGYGAVVSHRFAAAIIYECRPVSPAVIFSICSVVYSRSVKATTPSDTKDLG
jgi:hypothetical protein